MKSTQRTLKLTATAFLFAMGAFLGSCKKDSTDPISTEGSQTASNETAVASQTDETDDMSNSALTYSDKPKGGRVAESNTGDYRLNCATLTFGDSTTNKASGSVTIDFGSSGCTDSRGNTRTGQIIITWSGGRWYLPGSVHHITFHGYSINTVQFSDNDHRTVTNVSTGESPLTWTVEASHNLTWPVVNGVAATASRTVHQTRQLQLGATLGDDKFIITQTVGQGSAVSGTNRHGKDYSIQITSAIQYGIACSFLNRVYLPVQGVEVITYDGGKVVTLDFGTGTCDNTFTLTENGHTVTVSGNNSASN